MSEKLRDRPICQERACRREWFCWVGRQVSWACLGVLAALVGFRSGKGPSRHNFPCVQGERLGAYRYPVSCQPDSWDVQGRRSSDGRLAGADRAWADCRSCPIYARCPEAERNFSNHEEPSRSPSDEWFRPST